VRWCGSTIQARKLAKKTTTAETTMGNHNCAKETMALSFPPAVSLPFHAILALPLLHAFLTMR
jgi:hypothetical protein